MSGRTGEGGGGMRGRRRMRREELKGGMLWRGWLYSFRSDVVYLICTGPKKQMDAP